jgi:hypothetical protein
MSKSYKKPIITDTSKAAKKISHSKFRKRTKQKIQESRFDELPLLEKEVTNQYDVCDWKFRVDEDSDYYEKSKRK